MASELCMNCFSVKGKYEVCPFCGYAEDTPPAQPHYLEPGTILADHFIVGTVIGVGGFGIIYKCYDTTLGVIVAIKEFYPAGLVNRAPGEKKVGLLSGEKTKKYQEQIKRFLMEARSIAHFGKARDIVNVYDFFEENNTAYIIMEYIDGVLLKDYLEKAGQMEVKTAMAIIEPVVEAVKKIHAQGIIHRDISPDNIFIASDEAVKVFDFGAARLNDSLEGAAGEKVIKVGYSAPEQYRDSKMQGYFTDIYSVGAIFYQMLTGKKPIESTEREYDDELKSPLELGVKLDANLDRAVMEALAVQPELRFQGIQQFDDAIHGHRVAEYPKDKLKKRKRKKYWIAAGSISLMLAIIVGITLVNTVYKKENVMFETNVTKDTVTVWVDSQDMKETLNDITEKFAETESGDSEAITQMKKENRNITFKIRDISIKEKEYKTQYHNMDDALDAAVKGKEEFPDLFVSDNVSDLDRYDLVSFQDNVYQNINPQDYLYFSVYEKYFSDMKEMPISFDVLLFYGIDTDTDSVTEAMKKKFAKQKIKSSTLLDKTKNGTIELQEILDANTDGQEHTYLDERTAALAAILKNPDEFDTEKGVFTFQGKIEEDLNQCLEMKKSAMQEAGWKTSSAKSAQVMYGNSVLAGSGYRSQLYQMKLGNTAVPYQVLVPVVDGKMLVCYEGKLAVSGKSSKNKQIAAMRFVYFALGQQQCAADKDMAYPVSDVAFQDDLGKQRSIFDEFFTINTSQKIVRTLVKEKSYPCVLLAKGSGKVTDFADGIREQKISGVSSIKSYCKKYKKEQEKLWYEK